MARASGTHLVFCDDDDVATPDALQAIRDTLADITEPKVLLFRFRSFFKFIFWDQRGLIAQGHVGGHCIVVPNVPEKLGHWAPHYEGDFTFIRETVDLWGEANVVWRENLIAWARPTEHEWDTLLSPKMRVTA
jgi:hypothetical protein